VVLCLRIKNASVIRDMMLRFNFFDEASTFL